MCLIFAGSGDSRSFEHSSRFVEPVVRWLLHGASEPTIRAGVFAIRKLAHVSEYAVLATLVWWALRGHRTDSNGDWNWKTALITLAVVVLYAITDELHQTFVPTRQGTFLDVLVDTSGAVLALLFLRGFTRWRRRR